MQNKNEQIPAFSISFGVIRTRSKEISIQLRFLRPENIFIVTIRDKIAYFKISFMYILTGLLVTIDKLEIYTCYIQFGNVWEIINSV